MLLVSSLPNALQDWLYQRYRSVTAWFSTGQTKEASEPEETLLQLPKILRQDLLEQLQQLPIPVSYADGLEKDFHNVFEAWYTEDTTHTGPNNWNTGDGQHIWIIVSPSVTNLPTIIESFLQSTVGADVQSGPEPTYRGVPVRWVQWPTRPDRKSLRSSLEQNIGSETDSKDNEIIVIPCLEHCFLRSVDGLDSIDYLKTYLLNDPSKFLILGVGEVAWKYLQAICALDTYGSQITHLGQLSEQQLSQWIEPLTSKLNLDFKVSSLKSKLSGEGLSQREKYFEVLADESDGIDTVAIQLFLNSLQVLNGDQQTERPSHQDSDDRQRYKIQAHSPQYSRLPELEGEDIYLLYSLLLHRALTKKALAESLGLTAEQIEYPVQTLRKAGVLEQQNNSLRLNPAYYPAVCKKLTGDNFSL